MSDFSAKVKRRLEKVRRYGFVPVVKQYLHRKLYGRFLEYRRYMKEVEPLLWDEREKEGSILFSVCVPVYNCRINELRECINSVLSQDYQSFELVLSDDFSTDPAVKKALLSYKDDKRVKLVFREKNGGISKATNDAIKNAKGDFVCFMDCDDVLSPHALMEFFAFLSDHPDTDILYSDEDKLSEDSKRRYEPFFKPDWSPDTFMSLMYTNHFSAVRRSLLNEAEGLRSEFDGAQDYDLFMRLTEMTGNDRIGHVPKVLYHWRATSGSTAKDPNAKQYVFERAKKLKEEALKRRGIKGKAYFSPETYQVRVVYEVPKETFLSIIIPSKNNYKVLRSCIESIQKEELKNYEIIIVDNGSDDEVRHEIEDFSKKYDIRYIFDRYDFNFSKMCNIGAKAAKGDILLFLNDDTSILQKGTLQRMMGQALLPHTGAVGAKLLYPDAKRIQHSGIINLPIGPSHALIGQSDEVHHYFDRNRVDYNFLAVTGACMMVSQEKFETAGGFDEELPIAYNDVDLCFSLFEKGYYNVLRTDAVFLHYESLSRGTDEAPEKEARREKELEKLYEKHPSFREKDPFYNPNLIKNGVDFQIGLPDDGLTEKKAMRGNS